MTTIEVTQQDIDTGFRLDCTQCPVARAINRGLSPGCVCGVGQGYIKICSPGLAGRTVGIDMPPAVRRFINRYDTGKKTKPFTFDLNIPAEFRA